MVFIQSHIRPTSAPMLQSISSSRDASKAIIDCQEKGLGYGKNTKLVHSSDFSSFDNHRLHLHYERS
jgi:hypothetical protein